MPLKCFDDLYQEADQLSEAISVVAAGGADSTVLQALDVARRRGWVKPIVTGDKQLIQNQMAALEIDPSSFTILSDDENSAQVAVEEIHAGRAKLLMKGQIATPSLMKAVLNKETGLRTGKTICQVVLMEIPRDNRCFLLTDTGITVEPNLNQKRDLIQHVVETAHVLGCEEPRVAIMSASEKVTGALPDTLEAADLAKQGAAGEFGKAVVHGPLSFDLAYATSAGEKKGVLGEVTGEADALVFPNLLSANLTVKGIMYTADCRFGGVLKGTTSPVVFMSRADNVDTRLNSLAYALGLV